MDAGYVLLLPAVIGGHHAGETASALALTTSTSLVLERRRVHVRIDEGADSFVERIRALIQEVDREVADRARTDSRLAGMGTTLTCAMTAGDQGFVFHAGDSRAYLLRGDRLHRLTRDHTFAEELAAAGIIAAEEVATHPQRNVLTRVVGGRGGALEPEVSRIRLRRDDVLMLCSDGLTRHVDDAGIETLLREKLDPDAACNALIDGALAGGGHDNVTVIVARYDEAERASGL